MKRLIILLGVLLALSTASFAQESNPLADTEWQLVDLNGTTPIAGTTPTLSFNNFGIASGFAGCNKFTSSYAVEGERLYIVDLLALDSPCPNDDVQQQETAFIEQMQRTQTFALSDGQLTITDTDGEILVFQPALIGTGWELASMDGEPILEDALITLLVSDEMQVSGSAGCNNYSGQIAALGAETLDFSALASTLMACAPQSLMTQENAYLQALETASAYTIADDVLVLTYGEEQQLVFDKMPSVMVSVSYLERIALPPDAVISVSIADVSLMDAPSVTLTSDNMTNDGAQVPFQFELFYSPSQIDERNTYAVQARIEHEGNLLFVTDTSYPVITNGENEITLILQQVTN